MRFILASALVALFSWPALAQGPPACNEREVIVKFLMAEYSEATVAVGIASKGGLLEVLTSENGETWSIIVTSPKGMSCLVSSGEGWQTRDFQMPEEKL